MNALELLEALAVVFGQGLMRDRAPETLEELIASRVSAPPSEFGTALSDAVERDAHAVGKLCRIWRGMNPDVRRVTYSLVLATLQAEGRCVEFPAEPWRTSL